MDKERLEPNSPLEEAMWRAQVLRRTARICSAKAKELERMAKVDGNAPMRDGGTLKDVLKRIDNVMEWRFVNALGEVCLLYTSFLFWPGHVDAMADVRLGRGGLRGRIARSRRSL